MRKDTKEEVIEYINHLKNYDGYIQFSHRPIDREKDIFFNANKEVKIENEEGFIYEAHFYSNIEKKSIQIRQINDSWLVLITDLKDENFELSYQEYISDIESFKYKVKMAQIWEAKEDKLCENMSVKKLSRVVFAGFCDG